MTTDIEAAARAYKAAYEATAAYGAKLRALDGAGKKGGSNDEFVRLVQAQDQARKALFEALERE